MRPIPLVALLAFAFVAGCQSNTEQQTAATEAAPQVVLDMVERTAIVEAIDVEERRVDLLVEDGNRRTLLLGSEVRNLDQIDVGDQVTVRYHEAVAAALKEPGAPPQTAQVSASAVQAPLGAKPDTAISRQITTTVRVHNVDRAGPTVSFTGPNGVLRMIRVRDPDMQAFARTLEPGDEVDITYTEAVAVSVQPAPN